MTTLPRRTRRQLLRPGLFAALAVLLPMAVVLAPHAAEAQQPAPPPYQQVISANPFGLLL